MSNLILYDAAEKTFRSNGLGILTDAVDAKVQQRLNGELELSFRYPAKGIHFEEITEDAYVLAKPDPEEDPQPFRIYKTTAIMRGFTTVLARHKVYGLRHICVSPFTASSAVAAMQGMKTNAVTDCPFEFWTDKNTVANMTVAVPRDIWSLLGGTEGSVLDVYGGEYEFDGNTVKLWSHRGSDRGVTIRYGKNLVDLQQERNIANMITGVYPYWASSEGELVQLPEKILRGPGTYPEDKIDPLDLSQEFEEKPTEVQLRERAEQYMAGRNIGKPEVSLKVQFVQLEQTEEYKDLAILERVGLGDTVTVSFPPMGVEVTSRVVATEYDPIRDRYISVTIGKVKSSLASTISSQASAITSQGQQIREIPGKITISKSDIQKAVDEATAWLTNGKGYKLERRDGNGNIIDTLYLDKPSLETAVNVLRIGQSGIGFSHKGVNGPYTTAWTIDGKFNAGFITTGVLNASLIKAGVLQDQKGYNSINMATGKMKFTYGDIDLGKGKFKVNSSGEIYAVLGQIGNMRISNSMIRNDSVGIQDGISLYSDYAGHYPIVFIDPNFRTVRMSYKYDAINIQLQDKCDCFALSLPDPARAGYSEPLLIYTKTAIQGQAESGEFTFFANVDFFNHYIKFATLDLDTVKFSRGYSGTVGTGTGYTLDFTNGILTDIY